MVRRFLRVLFLGLFFSSSVGHAQAVSSSEELEIYHCELTAFPGEEEELSLSGNLVYNDGDIDGHATYLTLQFPIVSGLAVDGRVLVSRFRSQVYRQLTLHPRGETSRALAFTDLERGDVSRIEVSYLDVSYSLVCEPRES